MKKVMKKQIWLLGGLGLAAAMPIAIAASCGSSSTSTKPVDTTKIKTKLIVDGTSIHSNVKWSDAVKASIKDDSITKYQYYYNNTTPITSAIEVAKIAPNLWSENLPSNVNPDPTMRKLWVKIFPADGYTIATPILDITTSSGIDKVKTRLDELDSLKNADLTKVELLGTLDAAQISIEKATLPVGTRLEFNYNNSTDWVLQEALTTWIANNKADITIDTLRTIKARLAVTDTNLFLLDNKKEAPIDVSNVRFDALSTIPAEIFRPLNEFKVKPSSTHDAVAWDYTPAKLPVDRVASVVYLSGNYPTRADALKESESSWKADLLSITSIDYDHALRHLWAKITPTATYPLQDNLYDMTVTSGILKVYSKVEATSQYPNIDLSKIRITGNLDNPNIIEPSSSLPMGVKITYSLSSVSSIWNTAAIFRETLIANKASLNPAQIQDISARLEVTDPLNYQLESKNNKQAKPDTSDFKLAIPAIPTTVSDLLKMIKANVDSNNDNTTWDAPTLPATVGIQKYEYVEGNLLTEAQLSGTAITWSDTLPNKVQYDKTLRHLWARAVPAQGYALTNPYFDLTSTSGVQDIKTKIDTYPSYDAISLSNIKITGNDITIEIDESGVIVPTGAELRYLTIDSKDPLPKEQFKTWVLANPLTDVSKGAIKVQFEALSGYVISNKKITAPDVSGIVIPPVIPPSVTTYLTNIKPKSTATHDDLTWDQGVFTPTDKIASLLFLGGDYATENLAKAATSGWSASLPNSASYKHIERHLWVRFVPVAGKTLAIEYRDLTTSSQIQKVKSKVDLDSKYAAVDFESQAIVLGKTSNYRIDLSTLTLPEGSKVLFSWQERFPEMKTAVELSTYLVLNETTLNRDVLAQIKAHLVADNSVNPYIVVNDKASGLELNTLASFGTLAEPQETFANLFETVELRLGSTFDNLNWNIVTATVPTRLSGAVKGYSYLVGDYPSLTSNIKTNATLWTDNPAKAVSQFASQRHIWARVNLDRDWPLASGYADNIYVDLTAKSKIQTTPLISLSARYSTLLSTVQLSDIKISGSVANANSIVFDVSTFLHGSGLSLPTDIATAYSLDGGAYQSSAAFKAFIVDQVARGLLTVADINLKTLVKLVPTDPTNAFLDSTPATPIMQLTA